MSRMKCLARLSSRIAGTALLTLAVATSPPAATINVPGDYPTIASGVAAAASGDTVLVAAGTYNEASAVTFTTTSVTLDTSGSVTLVPAAALGAGVLIQQQGAVIKGLNIARTTANNDWMRGIECGQDTSVTLQNCDISGPGNGVGVILFSGADLTAVGCRFHDFNPVATWAAAVYMQGGSGGFSDVTIANCLFDSGCTGWMKTYGSGADKVGAVTVTDTTFTTASARAALQFTATAQYDNSKDILFQDCTFQGKDGAYETAEFFYNSAGPRSFKMNRCVFKAYNSLRKVVWYDLPTPTTFENVVFAGGKHEQVLRIWGGPPSVTFRHCTIANDGVTTAEAAGGVASSTLIDGWDGGRTFQVRNCLLFSPTNYSAALQGDAGSSANRIYNIDYSIIDHATPSGAKVTLVTGANYSNVPTGFVNAAAHDYHLVGGSPAVNTGVNLGVLFDAEKNPRPVGPAPDMGGYESPFVPVTLSAFTTE
jgi:hypothetical protein